MQEKCDFTADKYEFADLKDAYGNWCVGQSKKDEHVPEGICRKMDYLGRLYEGQFSNGHFHGYGRFIDSDGYCFVGGWHEDAFHGMGTEYKPDGEEI